MNFFETGILVDKDLGWRFAIGDPPPSKYDPKFELWFEDVNERVRVIGSPGEPLWVYWSWDNVAPQVVPNRMEF